ncbi:hypothetical protein J2Z81_001171 [Virgibacillus campisalis]|uniref:Uncharacterized protein n=1 Tax=Virgibacillus alimentarius TaxID=698769 RepID=A0ABS4S6U2_9BACI|nr:hypothetical protein [Virgibacillus alimentarius]
MVPPLLAKIAHSGNMKITFHIISYNDETFRQSLLHLLVRFGSSKVHSSIMSHWFAPATSSLNVFIDYYSSSSLVDLIIETNDKATLSKSQQF